MSDFTTQGSTTALKMELERIEALLARARAAATSAGLLAGDVNGPAGANVLTQIQALAGGGNQLVGVDNAGNVVAAGPSTGGVSTVVWRPGAVSAGNVYATWAEIVTAVSVLNGAITIGIDTDTAPAVIPPGAYDLHAPGVSGPRSFVGSSNTSPFIAPFVTLGPGAVTLTGLNQLDGVSIVNSSTVPVITYTDNKSFIIRTDGGVFQDVGAAAFIAVTGTGFVDLFLKDFAQIINFGGTNAITVAAGGVLTIALSEQANFGTGELVAAAGTTGVQVGYFARYGVQPGAPTVDPQIRQSGTAAIVVGTGKTAAIPAFISAATRIIVCLKTPAGDALTVKYAALNADRVNGNLGSFQISALAAAGGGAVNGADTSTIDWFTTTEA